MEIFITTMARVNKQITLDYMPSSLAAKAIIVCPPEEAAVHEAKNRNVLVCTEDGQGLAKKRDWLLSYAYANGIRRMAMLDDDVVLQRRRADMRITNATGTEYHEAFEWLETQLKSYVHAGWTFRASDYANPDTHTFAARQMYCLAFDVKKVVELGCSFSEGMPPFASMSDFYMTLQLLTKGHPNVMSLEWRAAPYKSNAPGGCSVYRTKNTIEASARFLASRFPEFVKLREKKSSWEGVAQQGENRETQTDVTIYWQKALKSGQGKK